MFGCFGPRKTKANSDAHDWAAALEDLAHASNMLAEATPDNIDEAAYRISAAEARLSSVLRRIKQDAECR